MYLAFLENELASEKILAIVNYTKKKKKYYNKKFK